MNARTSGFLPLSLALLVLIAGSNGSAQEQDYPNDVYSRESLRAADAVAREALGTFAELVAQTDAEALGFAEPGEVRSATLAAALPQYFVPLDRLREYRNEGDPGALLDPVGRLVYRIQVQGETRSSLTVHRARGGWEAESWGAPALARALASALDAVAEREAGPAADLSEVRVPALNLVFVGHREGGELYLTPIVDYARFDLQSGSTLPAGEVLSRILPAAREHNGLPT